METFYRSIPEFIVKTDDITKLSNRACDNLKLGDEVILVNGDAQKKYVITSKSLDKMTMIFFSSEATVEVIYQKADNVWSYEETKESAEIPQETLADIEKFLSGEMPNNNVLALIQQNGIAFGKYYIVGINGVEVVDEIPENYSGYSYSFYDDMSGFEYNYYTNGEVTEYSSLSTLDMELNGITFSQKATVWETDYDFDELGSFLYENASKLKAGDIIYSTSAEYNGSVEMTTINDIYIKVLKEEEVVSYNYVYGDEIYVLISHTETPIGFNQTYLTHSFDELDPTLKQIVDDAIADSGQSGVACTQQQWNAIKSLLNNALYIDYNSYSMIKSVTDGINNFCFGSKDISSDDMFGATLTFQYEDSDNLLSAIFMEV